MPVDKPSSKDMMRSIDEGYLRGIGPTEPAPTSPLDTLNPIRAWSVRDPTSSESARMLERLNSSTPVEQEVYTMTGMEPGLDRSALFPWAGSREGGDLQPAAPAWLYDTAAGALGAGVAAQGKEVSTDDALNTALTFVGGSLARSHVAGPVAEAGTQMLGMAVKYKGGNWLADEVEEVMSRLQYPVSFEARQAGVPAQKVNDWISTKLNKYIKNDMGTPEDPVRALAEQGILHVGENAINYRLDSYGKYPRDNQQLLAKSDLAKVWEGASDNTINRDSALDFVGMHRVVDANPWLAKVPDDTNVYTTNTGLAEDLGFEHLIDELRNSVEPNAGLPDHLRIDPNKLDRMTVPQVVQHVDKINRWRAENMAEANQALANNAATHIIKEYPETGLKWAQLKMPEGETNPVLLEAALKYEGDTMGHCVGGYCDEVAAGKTQIFSLRDKNGAPHVTIEVLPAGGWTSNNAYKVPDPTGQFKTFGNLVDDVREKLAQEYGGWGAPEMGSYSDVAEFLAQQHGVVRNAEIIQIKGKGNAAPTDKYIPAVQDFIRTSGYDVTGDLENSRMIPTSNGAFPWPKEISGEQVMQILGGNDLPNFKSFRAAIKDAFGNYYTEQELAEWVKPYLDKANQELGSPVQKSKGGSVERVYNDPKYI